ncbi:hypothetical protein MAPG_10393 [Magnaporthiopsis poae ATCC 64411]|uniref:Uncharacterized protein n=1 Tax=Magnaporthiopsis poae (strain ATCC 64411 / 73-15) TaxID=644358 RepID=A0A0C4ECG9_MAGP6|nr:hypothetical protein MAPG_10393 [Magnaporthiopsis poae ATCC 64411]
MQQRRTLPKTVFVSTFLSFLPSIPSPRAVSHEPGGFCLFAFSPVAYAFATLGPVESFWSIARGKASEVGKLQQEPCGFRKPDGTRVIFLFPLASLFVSHHNPRGKFWYSQEGGQREQTAAPVMGRVSCLARCPGLWAKTSSPS